MIDVLILNTKDITGVLAACLCCSSFVTLWFDGFEADCNQMAIFSKVLLLRSIESSDVTCAATGPRRTCINKGRTCERG